MIATARPPLGEDTRIPQAVKLLNRSISFFFDPLDICNSACQYSTFARPPHIIPPLRQRRHCTAQPLYPVIKTITVLPLHFFVCEAARTSLVPAVGKCRRTRIATVQV